MKLIKSRREFFAYFSTNGIPLWSVYDSNNPPTKYPFYMYTYEGGDGTYYKTLYVEDLNEMVSKLECVVL